MQIFTFLRNKFFLAPFFCLILTFLSSNTKAATCTAIASGNWTLAATWSCGHAPTCNDLIVIPNAFTVTVTSAVNLTGGGCANTKININGVLFFSGNASKMDLVQTATISIAPGAAIITDVLNNSQKITIGNGPAEWDSNTGNLFGPWVITDGVSASVLPIELVDFSGAETQSDNIKLNWTTASETNNNYFEIQKSYDGVDFMSIGKVYTTALDGNSSGKLYYEFIDNDVKPGINYYRIKQVDLNDNMKFHHVITVTSNKKNKIAFDVYPNPTNGNFFIDLKGVDGNKKVEVKFYNKAGKLVNSYMTDVFSIQSKIFSMNVGDEYEIGVYVVMIDIDGTNYYSKLVVE